MTYNHEKELEQLWEWLQHEDNLFAQRTSLLTVTQSMLLVAFTTIIASSIDLSKLVYVSTLSITGIATCVMWIYYGFRIDKYTIKKIKDILVVEPQFDNYSHILHERQQHQLEMNAVFGVLIPVLFIITWIILTGNYILLTF